MSDSTSAKVARAVQMGGSVLIAVVVLVQAATTPFVGGDFVLKELPAPVTAAEAPVARAAGERLGPPGTEATAALVESPVVSLAPPMFSLAGLAWRGPYFGALLLYVFLWLSWSGVFGYATAGRRDWVALGPLAVALVSRGWLALPSISENAVHFYNGSWDKHSVLLSLFYLVLQSLGLDPFQPVLYVNGALSALTTLPVYLWVRQRSGSRLAGLSAALLFAVDPIVVRFGPTDSPYALLLAAWFSGLALLSAPSLGAAQLVAGASLLGIAATCRIEGALYLLVSAILVDGRAILAVLRRRPEAGVAALVVVVALVALQMYFCLAAQLVPGQFPDLWPTLSGISTYGISHPHNEPVLSFLAIAGTAIGVAKPRHRFVVAATLAAAIAVQPMARVGSQGILVLHRFVPAAALQSVAAGAGVVALGSLAPAALARASSPVLAVGVALHTLVSHSGALQERYFFHVEFEMLRRHVAGAERPCTLLAVVPRWEDGDVDIQNLAQLLPGIPVLDCRVIDCVAAVERDGCYRYLRSASCFYLPDLASRGLCRGRATGAGLDKQACLVEACSRLETRLSLRPLAEEDIDLRREFFEGDRMDHFPDTATLGLFEVQGLRRYPAGPGQ